MTSRKPLVIIGGVVSQIGSGDTLDANIIEQELITLTNDEAGPVVIGSPVYMDAANGAKKAQANASGTVGVIALVKDTSISAGQPGAFLSSGVLTATTAQWNTATGGASGLDFGAVYYLDPAAAGKLTKTAPTTVGQFVVSVGTALSTTEMKVDIQPAIAL